ncbi:hypothetical protein [Algibacter sp.]|uniref:hypothetical protein n=1 Tax=Algibacter sp. TaxID=1872428 RepID=UPI003C77E239
MKNTFNNSLRTIVNFLMLNSKTEHIKLSVENIDCTKEEFSLESTEEYTLNKSLKHLEFISLLEINITDDQRRFFSQDFYHDLETAKLISKINTINTSRLLRTTAA